MKKTLLPIAALLLITLAGCAPADQPIETPTQSPSSTASETESAEPEPSDEREEYEIAIENSYLKLYETGMREEVTSVGDRYILSYSPQENFYAGLYNLELDDVIVVQQEELFTVASAYLALDDPKSVIVITDTGVSITNPDLGDFSLVIENGLVVSGSANDGSWTGVFSYEPDPEVTKMVEELVAEQQG